MTDDPAVILQVSGGSHGLEASYAAMRGLADTYDSAGDRLRAMARTGGRTLVDDDLLESSILSPGTAILAEAAVVAATTGPDGLLVECTAWEADAVAIRGSVAFFESADDARHDAFEVIDYLLGRQLGMALALGAPALVAGLPIAVAMGGEGLVDGLEDLVTDNPLLVQHVVNGGGGLLAGFTGGLLPTFTTNQAADVLEDLYPDGDPVVELLETTSGHQPSSVEDLLDHLAEIAALSQGADSAANGTIEVQTVTTVGGQVVHIVNLPGTDDLLTLPTTADDDVRDLGTNLGLIAGEVDDYQQGILQAMAEAGIGADEPVLIVGHSQGGMEAVAIAAGDSGYTVTDVVTAGSPTAQVGGYPAGLNVLSIEQHGDLVPQLDGEPNPPSVEQTTVVVDAEPGPGIEAHHDYDVYVEGGAAVDASTHPSVVTSVGSLHEHGFLGSGGQVTSQVFQITRAP
ncbi:hypothetical protein [Nocardioides dilutus]